MITAILIIVIVILLWQTMNYIALFNAIESIEKNMKQYYDNETIRILTAMYNREANIEALKRGEEVEV